MVHIRCGVKKNVNWKRNWKSGEDTVVKKHNRTKQAFREHAVRDASVLANIPLNIWIHLTWTPKAHAGNDYSFVLKIGLRQDTTPAY